MDLAQSRKRYWHGRSAVEATGHIDFPADEGAARVAGLALIKRLREDEPLDIVAPCSQRSSPYLWLAQVLASATIEARVPSFGVRSRILDSASLIAAAAVAADIGIDGADERLSARATLRNGLAPRITIHSLHIEAVKEIGAGGGEPLRLGVIETAEAWPGLSLIRDEPTHTSLPFRMSAEGATYVNILLYEARANGIRLDRTLQEVLAMMQPAPATPTHAGESAATASDSNLDRPSTTGAANAADDGGVAEATGEVLDLPVLVSKILSTLHVSACVRTQVSIGDYRIPGAVAFVQHALPVAITANTARHILPLIGRPLVDALIRQASVTLGTLDVQSMDESGLVIDTDITLSHFGPLDDALHFDQGLEVVLVEPLPRLEAGTMVAKLMFDTPLHASPASSEALRSGANGVGNFAAFVAEILQSDVLEVELRAASCSIEAVGAVFSSAMTKAISLHGLGGLGDLRLAAFEIFC
ncbi:hypothetical protein ACQY0O_002803 [Thecaphora frezii]